MIQKSESVQAIAKALIGFHAEVAKVAKSATNPFLKNKYAPLSSILDAIKDPLAKQGLSFVQFPSGDDCLTTLLMHESGEWLMDEYMMTPTKNDPQGHGSRITYQRRYALSSILGLNTEEDDDGTEASAATPHPLRAAPSTPPTTRPAFRPRFSGNAGARQAELREGAFEPRDHVDPPHAHE